MPTQRASTIRYRQQLYVEVCELVEVEFADDLQLDGIASRIASSRRQLQRAFAEVGGTTFREHLSQVRMLRAAELLSSTSLTIREVSHRVGYRQPAQFAKAFRRHRGSAPSEYRARVAQIGVPEPALQAA